MSSPPPASPPMVWPPSNPSGTVVPFPLPWGQTGCCPPGGMDALMKCYCDIQQASAFIGQILIDQINNNPAVTEAIIAAIEKSGSNLPLVGVTNGTPAQVGQVGEFQVLTANQAYPSTGGTYQPVSVGILQPGDWDIWAFVRTSTAMDFVSIVLDPVPPGVADALNCVVSSGDLPIQYFTLVSPATRALISVPTLFVLLLGTDNTTGGVGGTATVTLAARRRR